MACWDTSWVCDALGTFYTTLICLFTYLFLVFFFLVALLSIWDLSSPTRDWTRVPCSEVWSLNHWTLREVPLWFMFSCFLHLWFTSFLSSSISPSSILSFSNAANSELQLCALPCTEDNSTFHSRVLRGAGGKWEGRGGKGKKRVDRGKSEEEERNGKERQKTAGKRQKGSSGYQERREGRKGGEEEKKEREAEEGRQAPGEPARLGPLSQSCWFRAGEDA